MSLSIRMWETDSNGDQEKVGTFTLKDGAVMFDGDPVIGQLLDEQNVIMDTVYTAQGDPEGWLRAMPRIYSGTYLRAELVDG